MITIKELNEIKKVLDTQPRHEEPDATLIRIIENLGRDENDK